MRIRMNFYECEHQQDLQMYKKDLLDCNAEIVNSSIDADNEIGTIDFDIKDKEKFMQEFQKTMAFEYLE